PAVQHSWVWGRTGRSIAKEGLGRSCSIGGSGNPGAGARFSRQEACDYVLCGLPRQDPLPGGRRNEFGRLSLLCGCVPVLPESCPRVADSPRPRRGARARGEAFSRGPTADGGPDGTLCQETITTPSLRET